MGQVIFYDAVDSKEWGSGHPWRIGVAYWYNVDQYFKVQIYSNAYGKATGIEREKWPEVRRWCEKNLSGEVIIKNNSERKPEYIAYFELAADMIAFKLVWGKYLEE